jgi:hypothetical protein
VSDEAAAIPGEWLTTPDLVEVLGEPLGRVRRLIAEQHLVGSTRNGAFAVPSVFIVDGRPLASLRGTIIVLADAGFSDDEVIDWLLAGHKSAVRRVARTLA